MLCSSFSSSCMCCLSLPLEFKLQEARDCSLLPPESVPGIQQVLHKYMSDGWMEVIPPGLGFCFQIKQFGWLDVMHSSLHILHPIPAEKGWAIGTWDVCFRRLEPSPASECRALFSEKAFLETFSPGCISLKYHRNQPSLLPVWILCVFSFPSFLDSQ